MPCHPSLEEYLNAWIAAAGIERDKKGPLFRSMRKGDQLTANPMTRFDVLHMIKAPGPGRRPGLLHLLSYLSDPRNHDDLFAEWRHTRTRPDNCESRIAANDQGLRPH